MMRAKMFVAAFVGLMSMFILILTGTTALAVQNFTANVFGVSKSPTTTCPDPSGTCEILLSGSSTDGTVPATYNGWTITGTDVGHSAKLVAADDIADSLRIENAVITGPAGVAPCSNSNTDTGIKNCPTIYFSALLSTPPDNASVDVTFVRQIAGTLMRSAASAATNSAIRFHGEVETLGVGTDGYKKVTCSSPTPGCGTLDSPTYIAETSQLRQKGSGLPNHRANLVQLWFYSKFAGDKFTLQTAKIKNPGAGGSDPTCVVYAPAPNDGLNATNHCPQE
ncbi:MAG: hypothetical protein WCH20_08315 [Nitrospira sp.]